MRRLSFPEHLGLFLRSLQIQGSWSFKSMQSLGFFLALAPFLARRAADPGAALRRQMAFFNTHPIMSCYVLGVVARLEREGEGEKAVSAREALMGPLGAMGDGFFWSFLRPLAVLLGVAIAWFDYRAGALAMLLAWNIPTLWTRWSLIAAGYRHPYDPIEGVMQWPQREWAERLAPAIPVLTAFLLGLTGVLWGSLLRAVLLFSASLFLYSRGWETGRVVAALLGLLLLLGLLGGGGLMPDFHWPLHALEENPWFPRR